MNETMTVLAKSPMFLLILWLKEIHIQRYHTKEQT